MICWDCKLAISSQIKWHFHNTLCFCWFRERMKHSITPFPINNKCILQEVSMGANVDLVLHYISMCILPKLSKFVVFARTQYKIKFYIAWSLIFEYGFIVEVKYDIRPYLINHLRSKKLKFQRNCDFGW